MFFEGAEKKFELVVDTTRSLRELGDAFWRRVVAASRAEVLSSLVNRHCTAYLLSESSLFVFDHKAIMITCGRTGLPRAVDEILDAVSPECVRLFVYERKNEVFPHEQPTSFFDDAAELHRALPGRAYQFGDEDEHHLYLFHLERPFTADGDDTTVEILMHGIDDEVRRRFERPDAAGIRSGTGLQTILPGFELDDHAFDPAGYSLNALRGADYWTLHVTPDPLRSYASFETNHRAAGDVGGLLRRVLEVFRPRAFALVTFEQGPELRGSAPGYRRRSHVVRDLECGYRVRFQSFYRPRPDERPPIELPLPARRG